MSLKRAVILSILSVSAIATHASAINDTIAATDTIWFDDGGWYTGQIADSLFNGYGKMVYADSTIYVGEWKDGLWNGKGELYFPDGDSYNGEFKDHEFSGYGTYLYADGAHYEGYWEQGMFNGSGTMTYNDGSIYAGEWRDDMKNGIGVYYDSQTGALFKGDFSNDLFTGPYDNQTDNSYTQQQELPGPYYPSRPARERPDTCWHWKGDTYLYLTYGTGHIFSIHADFYTSKRFFAGFSFGFCTDTQGIGKESVTYDDDTGEKITLIGWDWYMDEVMTENSYTMFQLAAEGGISWGWFSLGSAIGLGLQNTVRNCRSLPNNDSYYESGTLYYRNKITGVKFVYDVFTDFTVNRSIPYFNSVSLRTGYCNTDGFHIGIGISF